MQFAEMKATARIQVTLDVPMAHNGDWTNETDVARLRREAIEGGLKKLQQILDGAGGMANGVQVVSEPRVTIVLVEDL